jgi:hypothetical protein
MSRAHLSDRRPLRGLALCLWLAACATTPGGTSSTPIAATLEDPPARPGVPALLIAMPASADFVEVRRALVAEVHKSFNVATLVVTRDTSTSEIAAAIDRVQPVCAVLMNNVTLNLFQAYEAAHQERPALPTVVVMAAFLDEIRGQLRRATGISYEVPAVTAFVNLRSILATPIHRVGVVYRPVFRHFVDRQQEPASREHITIVGRQLPPDFSPDDLRQALHALTQNEKVDALWLLNDNLLLRDAQFLDETWRAELRGSKLPLVVGVPNLVNPASPLGTLAVVPDHEALGLQTSNLIFDLADNGWQVERHPIDLPLSVKTIVDLRQARTLFQLRPDAPGHIDKALE